MMDSELDFVGNAISYVKDEMTNLLFSIEDLSGVCDGQWEAVEVFHRRVRALLAAFDGCVPTEIHQAMDEMDEERERRVDLADANSY